MLGLGLGRSPGAQRFEQRPVGGPDDGGLAPLAPRAVARAAPDTLARAAHAGLRIGGYLDRNDAYGYFEALGDLVVTGPTNTNVNDFRAILVL